MADNEKVIWDALMSYINNPFGAAAVMGNLRAESSLNPLCMTGKNAKQWKTAYEYATAVNTGQYDQYSFAHDGIAFGLAQWLFWSRKQALHTFAKGLDISSVATQLWFLAQELQQNYKTVWNALTTATDIATPCDIFMMKYEKPGTTTETAKQKRRSFAIGYFDKYTTDSKPAMDSKPKNKYVITSANSVIVRAGNSTDYSPIIRIEKVGSKYPWVATAANNWHAIKLSDRVGWIKGDYVNILEE